MSKEYRKRQTAWLSTEASSKLHAGVPSDGEHVCWKVHMLTGVLKW